MRLPITAYGVARLTHAPNAVGLFESGVARYAPAEGMLFTMCDGPNQLGAAWTTGLIQIMGLLSGGRVHAGFIGGAEIDRFGNINTSYIGDIEAPKVKLPGSGGAPRYRRHGGTPDHHHQPSETPARRESGLHHLARLSSPAATPASAPA